MPDRLDQLDYYTLLGIEPSASAREIRKAFRDFARRYHPDRFSAGSSERKVERANEIYRRGSEALQVLLHPASRKSYDDSLTQGKVRMSAEERDRAIADSEQPKQAATGPDIRSPQAMAYYKRAVAAGQDGRWRDAWKALRQALEMEPGNKFITGRIKKVEAKIRRLGD